MQQREIMCVMKLICLEYVFLISCIIAVSLALPLADETVTVSTSQGKLRGKIATTVNGLTYYSFQGIPYAKPPVKELRFKAPQPADSWEGVRDALNEGNICPQLDQFTHLYSGKEDCLFVNVYTTLLPSEPSEPLKSVMVWIHGGGYVTGSGSSNSVTPDFMLQEDVLVVTLNYRLGALGFLSTGDPEIPGNNGLKDQVLALRWVQQNIAQFGGDPGKVTIFGVSAGGSSVHHLVLSSMAAGLFQNAIAQSGSALDEWAYGKSLTARTRTVRLCELFGSSTNNSQEMATFLRSLEPQDILVGVWLSMTDDERNLGSVYFTPTSESSNGAAEDAFLEEEPITIITEGKFNDVPFISGSVSHEGMLRYAEIIQNASRLDYYNQNFELLIPVDLEISLNTEESRELANKIKHFYFGESDLNWDHLVQYINLNTDTLILFGVDRHVRYHAAVSKSPVYEYELSFNGKLGFMKQLLGDSFPAVSHGDDISYLFYNPLLQYNDDSSEVRTLKRMLKMWTNFAKTGNPTPELDPLLQNVSWSPLTPSDHFYLDIGNDLILKRNLENDRLSFWEDIYISINGKPNSY